MQRGGGLELFGHCPYMYENNTFQKVASLNQFLSIFSLALTPVLMLVVQKPYITLVTQQKLRLCNRVCLRESDTRIGLNFILAVDLENH